MYGMDRCWIIGCDSLKLLKICYEKITHREAPYYYDYSLLKICGKPLRKFMNVVVIPNIVFNHVRIFLYRLCGFKIGKNVFIGMKCYLDDMCYDQIVIEDNVTISYGVYMACHGIKQGHHPITVKENAYIGMRANIVSRNGVVIGKNAVVGACSLVNCDVTDDTTVVGIPARNIMKQDT